MSYMLLCLTYTAKPHLYNQGTSLSHSFQQLVTFPWLAPFIGPIITIYIFSPSHLPSHLLQGTDVCGLQDDNKLDASPVTPLIECEPTDSQLSYIVPCPQEAARLKLSPLYPRSLKCIVEGLHLSSLAPLYPKSLKCLGGSFTPAPWHPYTREFKKCLVKSITSAPNILIQKWF